MSSQQRNVPSYLNEEALMNDFRHGDGQSFRYIFDTMVRPLTSFVENIVYSNLEAEDIVASCFSKLFNARQKMISFEHVKRSLYVIARNESIDYLRHKSRFRQVKGEISYLSADLDDHIETERVKAVFLQTILSEIEQLPSQRKKVLKLYFFEQKTTVEIATLLGLNTQTVLNHKSKALEALREKLPHFAKLSLLAFELFIMSLLINMQP
jgi:RNA polymerase sigma factor (sigma-70 family)